MEKKTDLRIQKTYLLLHNAFTELLEEKKFEEFTVNELCERAMIRRTTFYKHFADKYEYFAFYMDEICSDFQRQLPHDVTTNELNPYFLHMTRELLHFIEKHRKLVMNIADSSMFPVLFDSLTMHIMNDILQVLQNMNTQKNMSKIQMEGIATFYSGGLLNTLRLWLLRKGPIIEEDFIQIISILLTGV